MNTIRMAHLQTQGINFAVFDADAASGQPHDRPHVLARLTRLARAEGLLVQKSALAFYEAGRIRFFGTPDLVRYLANNWLGRWTHTLTVP